ncbi:MAG TPA: hypothetical protein VFE13_09010 [Caulobacteraceae bacterium]|jgi:hypothetical protein|nr:hypothetical protein [Caulobacteraceae bacterium]
MYARRMEAMTEEVAGSHVAHVSQPDAAARVIAGPAEGAGGKKGGGVA